MKKRVFLISTPTYYPGVDVSTLSHYINAVATGLARKGHEVHIMHSLDASAPALHTHIKAEGLTILWANTEMVENGKTGFVIERSERVPYYVENFISNWSYDSASKFMRTIKKL